MFCNIFHRWTEWQQYTKSEGIAIIEAQFRDCTICGKRQVKELKVGR